MLKHVISTTILCSSVALAVPALAQNASYCDEGYAAADTNNDNVLSEEEVSAVREKEFNDMDANGDGTVSREEYGTCMGAWAAESVAEPADEETFAAFDENEDGTLSADEFMGGVEETAMTQTDPGSMQATSSGSDSASASDSAGSATDDEGRILILRRLVLVPRGFDANRYGSMSQDEIAARAAHRFGAADANGDQQLSAEEWSDANQSNMENIDSYIDRSFESVDADQSGDVTWQEYYDSGMEQLREARSRSESDGSGSDGDPSAVKYRYPEPM